MKFFLDQNESRMVASQIFISSLEVYRDSKKFLLLFLMPNELEYRFLMIVFLVCVCFMLYVYFHMSITRPTVITINK